MKSFLRLWLVVAVLCYGLQLAAQQRSFISAQSTPTGLSVQTSDGALTFAFYANNALQVSFEPTGQTNPPSYALAENAHSQQGVIKEDAAQLTFSLGSMQAIIQKKPFAVHFSYHQKPLLAEERGYFANDTLKGFRFRLNPAEQLMGGGSRVLGMDRRGHRLKLYNRASYGYETKAELMYYSMPVVISSEKYALVFDNGASGFLDLGASDKDILRLEAVGGRMSYLLVAGDTWPELTQNLTAITGRQPLLPRWALGNIASRMGYHTQKEVEEVAARYAQDSIPLDAIVLDIYWFGPELKGFMGNLEWDLDSFPNPKQMMANLKAKGVKTVLVTEPFILKNTLKFDECVQQNLFGLNEKGEPYIYDFYFGTTALLDIFKPETKKWFWGIYKKHMLEGVDGWWGDLGEPEVHPDDLLHVNGRADHVHNLYGHEWAKTLFEGFQADFPSQRPFILMRSGFVGSQRYGMVPWTGDVSRSWGGLKPQVEISLQMGMQGIGWMHSDLGGFAGNYKDEELYTRWLQYGVFQPVYRTHAQQEVPPEPIFWDELTKSRAREAIKLRYALLPYNYTLMYQNSTSGKPLMQPLFYIDDTPSLLANTTEYLWGDNFLVSPITEKGATQQTIYLPKGTYWMDYYTGKWFKGRQKINVQLSPTHIPVFVKAGAFIPMVPGLMTTSKYSSEKLELHYYFHRSLLESEGMYYEDDGVTPQAVEKKAFEILKFESEFEKRQGLRIIIEPQGYDYPGKPTNRSINLVIHGLAKSPKMAEVNGDPVLPHSTWTSSNNTFSIPIIQSDTPVIVVVKE
jgi:oligosaccharide 4-alpha-D-glucosyltransferase